MLDNLGPEAFILYICEQALSVRPGQYHTIGKRAKKGMTISIHNFIRILYKYTKTMRSKVALDAYVELSEDGESHMLFFTGIRDVGQRTKQGNRKLPGSRKGYWACNLERALRIGILEEQIRGFRKHLSLRVEDGVSENEFYEYRGLPII